MKKLVYMIIAGILLSIAIVCGIYSSTRSVFSVYLYSEASDTRIEAWDSKDGKWYIFLPSYAKLENFCFQFETDFRFEIAGKEIKP